MSASVPSECTPPETGSGASVGDRSSSGYGRSWAIASFLPTLRTNQALFRGSARISTPTPTGSWASTSSASLALARVENLVPDPGRTPWMSSPYSARSPGQGRTA